MGFFKRSKDEKMVMSTMDQLLKQGRAVNKAAKAGDITPTQKAAKMKSLNNRIKSLNNSPSNLRTVRGKSKTPNRGR